MDEEFEKRIKARIEKMEREQAIEWLKRADEEAADTRTCDDAKRQIETGVEERIPAGYAKPINNDESPNPGAESQSR